MAPKPVYALKDELDAGINQLRTELQGVHAGIAPPIQATEQRLQGAVQALNDQVTRNASAAQAATDRVAQDSKAYTEHAVDGLHKKILPYFPPIDDKINSTADGINETIRKVDIEVRKTINEELTRLAEQFEARLSEVRAELLANDEKKADMAAAALAEQRKQVDASVEAARREASELVAAAKETAKKDLGQAVEEQRKVDEKQDERAQRSETEIYLKLERISETLQENKDSADAEASRISTSAKHELEEFRESAEERIALLDTATAKLKDAVQEVEQISTRRVDWVIRDAADKLRPPSASQAVLHSSWFSPKFNCSGAHGLQLELQVYRQAELPVPGDEAGDCAVFLWACKGMDLSYRLYIGNKSATIEKVFNGRVPYGTKRMCWLKDQINRSDNTLKVSVEILESIREIEHPIKPLLLPQAADGGEAGDSKATGAKPDGQLEGRVLFKRHVNHRLLDQVKSEVEMMRSRMVRKIEWRVENALMLRRCFPVGEPICSTSFSAAGLEGLQLIFYPSGYNGSTEGFCSLFLFGPAGATLKCMLSAGNQKREASHSFEEPGAFGRTNFARFESVVDDVEDTVLIGLEIEEAHQDVRAKVAHPSAVAGDRRNQVQMDGSVPAAIESVVKLQRVPGRTAHGLEDTRVLPSLWTAKSQGDILQPQDGMHTFDELRARARASGRLGEVSFTSGGNMGTRSESMPQLSPKELLERTARPTESTPLPLLSRTSDSSLAFPRKARGERRGKNVASSMSSFGVSPL